MTKLPKIYKTIKTKSVFSDVKFKDLDYLSENCSLGSYFNGSNNNTLINKLNVARNQILTEKQDTIVEMIFKGCLSISDIAKEFKTSRQNIHAQYYMAIKKLKEYFKK